MKRFGKAVKKGFTLVELVIVIAVIAVLSAVLIPTFGGILSNAKVTAMNKSLNSINSDLISKAMIDGITYYTPDAVRHIVKEHNFKEEDIPEGYTVWYNQETCNLSLKKDADVFGKSSASAGMFDEAAIKTVKADGGALEFSAVSSLPRRPEAINPANKNDLVLFTPNDTINTVITWMYNIASDVSSYVEGVDNFNSAINSIQSKLTEVLKKLSTVFGDSDSTFVTEVYKNDFSVDTTIFVSVDGYMYTNASSNGGVVKNVLFSKNEAGNTASKIVKNVIPTGGAKPTVECPIEIPATTTSIDSEFESSVSGSVDSPVKIIIHDDIDVGGLTEVIVTIAKRGDTSSSSTGGMIDYVGYNEVKKSILYNYSDKLSYTMTSDGFLADTKANKDSAWFTTRENGIKAKIAVPSIGITISEALKAVGISEDAIQSVTYRETNGSDYRTIFFTATYTKTSDGVTSLKGVRFDTGYGYITDIYDFTNNNNVDFTNVVGNENKAFGYGICNIEVPKVDFLNYKGYEVYASYRCVTKYYENVPDMLGKGYTHVLRATEKTERLFEEKLTADSKTGLYSLTSVVKDFVPVNAGSYSGTINGHTYSFKNIVELDHVTLKVGNDVLFVKFY